MLFTEKSSKLVSAICFTTDNLEEILLLLKDHTIDILKEDSNGNVTEISIDSKIITLKVGDYIVMNTATGTPHVKYTKEEFEGKYNQINKIKF